MIQATKRIVGVVAAEVNSIEQRQIVKGIITRAQVCDMHTVVLTNIYNPYEYDEDLSLENQIYELMLSPELCGIILISESFVSEHIKQIVAEQLAKRQDIPVVVVGLYQQELDYPNVRFINADDGWDIESATRHFIEMHHLTKIDILTGQENNESTIRRLAGYRRALEANNIPFDPARVHYGDFWTTSGEALARRYIAHDLPLPEAIVCCNDFMAFGLLDTFVESNIRVPQDIMVMGYEYVLERIYHTPLLSTYQRGRSELGEAAVQIIMSLISGEELQPFQPPKGRLISGDTCTCGVSSREMNTELMNQRVKQQFDKWNVLGTMEQQLTRCSTLDELVKILGEQQFLVRWVQDMYLCLFDNWYDADAVGTGEILSCRTVMPWNSWKQSVTTRKFQFSTLLSSTDFAVAHYYVPIFFGKKMFGYFVLQYNTPDTYDDIFRNWMKALSNGLEFLCMKNDIRYLLSCQNLSEQRDSLTGLYSQTGFERALAGMLAVASEPIYTIIIRVGAFRSVNSTDLQEQNIRFYQQIAEMMKNLFPDDSIAARVETQTFVCAGAAFGIENCEKKREKLMFLLLHQPQFLDTFGMDTLVSESVEIPANTDPQTAQEMIREKLENGMNRLALQRQMPHAETLFAIRRALYQNYNIHADDICKAHSFSAGYFRQIYKDIFGVSFHQDVINARISKAVCLLATSAMSVASVAENCGYEDYNYFLRQFQKVIGMTPGQYRKNV